MMTEKQKRTCSRCTLKQVYSAHKVTECTDTNDAPRCATVVMNIQGYYKKVKREVKSGFKKDLVYI